MCKLFRNKFIGRRICLRLSEPFGYVSNKGDNIVMGTIRKIGRQKDKQPWAVLDLEDFVQDGVDIRNGLVLARYDDNRKYRRFGRSDKIIVNFSFDPIGLWTYPGTSLEEMLPAEYKDTGYIGGLWLANPSLRERLFATFPCA